MDSQIAAIPREMIEAKARAAFARGVSREGHGFNWGAPAIGAWQEEWDRCAFQQMEGVEP